MFFSKVGQKRKLNFISVFLKNKRDNFKKMKLTKEYLIEYFEIYAKILQIVRNNVLNSFDSGELDHMNQEDFSTNKLLFKLNYDHLKRFKKK